MSDAHGPTVAAGAMTGTRLAVVTAAFNPGITGVMQARAERRAKELGFDVLPARAVAGTWDLPFVADRLLMRGDVDAVVVIGVVITGDTKHDEAITLATAKTLQEVAIARGKPVGLGVTGHGQTQAQAEARLDRADAAVDAVAMSLLAIR